MLGLENAESMNTSVYFKDKSDFYNEKLRQANDRKDNRMGSKFLIVSCLSFHLCRTQDRHGV